MIHNCPGLIFLLWINYGEYDLLHLVVVCEKNMKLQSCTVNIAVLNCELVKRLIAVLLLRVQYVKRKMGCFYEIEKAKLLSSL